MQCLYAAADELEARPAATARAELVDRHRLAFGEVAQLALDALAFARLASKAPVRDGQHRETHHHGDGHDGAHQLAPLELIGAAFAEQLQLVAFHSRGEGDDLVGGLLAHGAVELTALIEQRCELVDVGLLRRLARAQFGYRCDRRAEQCDGLVALAQQARIMRQQITALRRLRSREIDLDVVDGLDHVLRLGCQQRRRIGFPCRGEQAAAHHDRHHRSNDEAKLRRGKKRFGDGNSHPTIVRSASRR